MDRIALAKRLESLSSVFASHTPYNRDLKAMSYVLNKMSDDKFTNILSGDFSAEDFEACMCGKGPMGPAVPPMMAPQGLPVEIPEDEDKKVIVIKTEEGMPMSAEASEKTAGMFWCREASKAVVDGLLRDVLSMDKTVCCDTKRHLEKEQIPDGTHAGLPERGVALKPEQTPDIAESLDSDMVNKSHGKVEKEAGSKEASLADIKKKKEEKDQAQVKKDVEDLKKAKKEQAKKASDDEEDEKPAEEAKPAEKDEEGEDDKDASTSSIIEGIELSASMDEFELEANEAEELSKLFR